MQFSVPNKTLAFKNMQLATFFRQICFCIWFSRKQQCSTLRFRTGCPSGNQPKCFGCPWYNFSCPDIIKTAEILLDRYMLFFLPMNNRTVLEKTGVGVFCADKFCFTHCFVKLWNKKPQRLSLTPLPTENNSLLPNGIGYWQLSYTVGESRISWTWFG